MAAQRSLYEPVSETAAAAAAGLRDGGGLVLDVDADTVGLVSTAKTTKRLRPGIGPRILYRIAACLPVRLRRLLPLLLIGGVYAIIGTLFLFNYTAILHLLQELSTWLKDHGLGGALIVMSLIFATSFPFVPGYGTLATFAGYVYGVPLGFMVSIVSALSGACACFILCRRFGRNYAQRLVNSSPHLDAVLKAVDRRGIKLLILIRLAPYPYSLMNALLSLAGISLKMFSIATAISLTKVITHVAIGANLENLTDALFQHPSMGKILLGILAGLLGIGVTIYIFRVARQAVQAADEEIAERGYMPGEAYPMESTIWQLGSSDDGGDRTEGTSKRSSKTVKNAKKSDSEENNHRNTKGKNKYNEEADDDNDDDDDDDWGWQ